MNAPMPPKRQRQVGDVLQKPERARRVHRHIDVDAARKLYDQRDLRQNDAQPAEDLKVEKGEGTPVANVVLERDLVQLHALFPDLVCIAPLAEHGPHLPSVVVMLCLSVPQAASDSAGSASTTAVKNASAVS